MDLDLWLRLARLGPIQALPTEVLARFRVHPLAKSTARAAATAREDLRIRRHYGASIRSRAAVVMIRIGYVRPITSPLTRPFRRIARRLLLGR
jgi:hypothetical protein